MAELYLTEDGEDVTELATEQADSCQECLTLLNGRILEDGHLRAARAARPVGGSCWLLSVPWGPPVLAHSARPGDG